MTDKTRQINSFIEFLGRLDDIARAEVERRYAGDERGLWAKMGSSAVYGASEMKWSNDQRAEGRAAARDAVSGDGPVVWAAEYAINEIQGASVVQNDKGMLRFFFLPMFGFETPAQMLVAEAA